MKKRKFLVEIECEDTQNVIYAASVEVMLEEYMEGFRQTGVITKSNVNVTELETREGVNTETLTWHTEKPEISKEYLVALKSGYVDNLHYYVEEDIWMDDCDGEEENVIAWAEKPLGYVVK